MRANRKRKAFDAGRTAGLRDHGLPVEDWTPDPDRSRRRRLASEFDRGWTHAYDGATAEARRAHRRLTGRD